MDTYLSLLNSDLGISYQMLTGRGLLECKEASCLVIAEVGADGRDHLLIPAAARAWGGLKSAALSDGISLFIVSAFRSVERQADIVRRKLLAGGTIEDILAVCAPPGFSEHHSGCAVDVSTPGSRSLDVSFESTPAFGWLCSHAAEYGFRLSYPEGNASGYQYEPWHWCFRENGA